MVSFRVRATSLGEVSAQLNTVIAVFDGQVGHANTVATTVLSTWEGEDADKFAEAWEEWNATSLLVRAALTGLAAQLVSAQGSYTTVETTQQGGFVERRQAHNPVVDNTVDVGQRVDAGQDRTPIVAPAASGGGAFLAVSRGQGDAQGQGGGGKKGSGGRVAASEFTEVTDV